MKKKRKSLIVGKRAARLNPKTEPNKNMTNYAKRVTIQPGPCLQSNFKGPVPRVAKACFPEDVAI